MMISKATIDTDTNEKLTVSPDTEYQDKEISSTITKRDLWIVGFRGLLWRVISIMSVCRLVVFVLALSQR